MIEKYSELTMKTEREKKIVGMLLGCMIRQLERTIEFGSIFKTLNFSQTITGL